MTEAAVQQLDETKRIGRSVLFVHQHESRITNNALIRAEIEILLLTGRAMDFAARLKGHQEFAPLTHELAHQYARYAGVGGLELMTTVLPALKRADLIDYQLSMDGRIVRLDEFVGITATVTEQTVRLLNVLSPRRSDIAFLHSVEIGALAPLAESQHLQEIVKRGFSDAEADEALRLAKAVKINMTVPSAELNEPVIFSPYVWGTKQVSLANFLAKLPPNERDALLGMSQQVLTTPGLHIGRLTASPAVVQSARSVGLIQAATVQSAAGGSSTYVFSPLLETEDNQCSTTEALHLRKLFVAHILFGHEGAKPGLGRVRSPSVLVSKLVNTGVVGSATNIGTDYHLLEAAGVVSVAPDPNDDRKAFLRLIKPEIAEAGLDWIRRITDTSGTESLRLHQTPAKFETPENLRGDAASDGAANEILVASINELRKETQRAARRDDPWS